MLRTFAFLVVASLAGAMTRDQAQVTRDSMSKFGAPQFSTIVDGVQTGTYAFTDADRRHTYIDYKRFANAPMSLRNVVRHEIDHLRGRDHNTLPGDPMSYRLTVDPAGNVVEDAAIWAQ